MDTNTYKMLPFVKPEVRKAYFLKAFGRPVEQMAILSFGACNYNCPYCKRDGQFKGYGNQILRAREYSWAEIKEHIDTAIAAGRRIRLSGGDPCMFPQQALQVAEYVWGQYGRKISIAHNGSSLQLIKLLLPYLEYAAIDVKGASDAGLAYRAGMIPQEGRLEHTLCVIETLAKADILVDVRTCVFGDTSEQELTEIRDMLLSIPGARGKIFWTLRKYNEIASCDFVSGDAQRIKELAEKLATSELKVGFRDKWTGATFEIF